MNDLTTNMKPVCFGRYLIDVPQKAEVALGLAESDEFSVEYVEAPAPTDAGFNNRIGTRKSELQALRHETEGTRFRGAVDLPDGLGEVLLYRENGTSHRLTMIEALIRRDGREWSLRYLAPDDDIAEMKQQAIDIATHLVTRSQDNIPAEVGACLRYGLLSRSPTYGEQFAGGSRMENLSWTLSFRSETSKPRDKEHRLMSRAQDAVGMAGASSGIKVLRKREVTVDGRKGEEFIALYPGNGVVSFDAKLELYGDGTYRVPTIKLNLAANRLSPPDPNDKRVFLSDEEALALWDAVVKSIRPRPGAF